MSFLGNLLKIVAIGAFFIATGPFGLSVSSTLATALRIGGAVLGYLGALTERPRLLSERQRTQLDTTLEPGAAIPVVYGRSRVGAIVADWFLSGDTLFYAAVFCHGSRDGLGVAGFDELWLDQRKAYDFPTASRIWPYKIATVNATQFLGSTTQNVGGTQWATGFGGLLAPSSVPNSGWSATTDTGKGICCLGLSLVNVDTSTFDETAKTITTSSVANPTVITTSAAHGYTTGDAVRIKNHAGSTPNITGEWVITVTGTTTFTIPANVTVGGTGGTAKRFSEGPVYRGPPSVSAVIRGNRIYDSRTDLWVTGGDNPAMVIRDYLLASIYGCGYDVTMLHEQSFKDAATYCDVLVRHKVGAAQAISTSDAATERVNMSAAHGWATGTLVRIAGHSGSTPVLNGDHIITVTSSTSFTLNDVANITVGGTGGTAQKLVEQKRYTCNGVLDTSRPTADNLQELLSSCRGNLVWEQGQFKLTIRSPDVAAPTLTLDPSNIVGQWAFRNAGQEEKWNVVKASYVEPANGEFRVQDVQWPIAGAANAYLTADNNFQNTLELSLPFTNDQLMAQMTAQITLNEARKGISCQVRCTEVALSASVGDRVNVTHPTPGWTAKEFWAIGMKLFPDFTVDLSLQEYDATAYDLDTQDDRRTFPATTLDSVFRVPVPGAVTITALTPQGIKVSWVPVSYGMLDFYEIQARFTSAGEDYVTIERVRAAATGIFEAIAPLARPGQTWDARVRIVNVAGWPSDWVDASQLAIPVPAAASPGTGALIWTGYAPTCIPSTNPPTLNSATRTQIEDGNSCAAHDWVHRVSWDTSSPNDATHQIDLDVANDAAGVSYVALVTGLTTADSSYDDSTGVSGNTGGAADPVTYYRKYKVKLVRKSDSAVIDSEETDQGTLTTYSEFCA